MRNCTTEEIQKLLAKYPDAKKIAVENFLMTVGNNPNPQCALANLQMDANLYKWNQATQRAIKEGINIVKQTSKPAAQDVIFATLQTQNPAPSVQVILTHDDSDGKWDITVKNAETMREAQQAITAAFMSITNLFDMDTFTRTPAGHNMFEIIDDNTLRLK